MRAVHRVRVGGTNRNPSCADILYVGSNVYGKRGGRSGNPVDAVEVARGTAAKILEHSSLTGDTLVELAALFGGLIDGWDIRRHPEAFADEEGARRSLAAAECAELAGEVGIDFLPVRITGSRL